MIAGLGGELATLSEDDGDVESLCMVAFHRLAECGGREPLLNSIGRPLAGIEHPRLRARAREVGAGVELLAQGLTALAGQAPERRSVFYPDWIERAVRLSQGALLLVDGDRDLRERGDPRLAMVANRHLNGALLPRPVSGYLRDESGSLAFKIRFSRKS